MNGQSRMDSCAKCASTNLMGNGKNRVGNARYKCNDCSYCGVVKSRRAAESLKERATAMGQERSSLRGIARVLACSADSESNWIRKSLLLLSSNDSGLAAGSRPLSKAVKTRPMLELCLFESHFRLDLGRSLSSYQTNLLFYHRGDQAWATGQQLWLDTLKDTSAAIPTLTTGSPT
jgi:transposase-like protein